MEPSEQKKKKKSLVAHLQKIFPHEPLAAWEDSESLW